MVPSTRQALEVPGLRSVPAMLVARARAYVMLTRPNVSLLVALTAPPAVLLGGRAGGAPHGLLAALAGTLLLSAGCSAVNAWHERALDARMVRTRARPLPALRWGRRTCRPWRQMIPASGRGVKRFRARRINGRPGAR